MKNQEVFFNPFRLISPKLDAEASRIKRMYEAPPSEFTSLEDGLMVMISRLVELADLAGKSLVMSDTSRLADCRALAREIHDEERDLTGHIVDARPDTGVEARKIVILFPGRLERIGDLFESIVNVSEIKARDDVIFSDKANAELNELFALLTDVLGNFRDTIMTRNRALLEATIAQARKVAQMTIDFGLAHEDRLLGGLCSPKASSLYLDILDSVRQASRHIIEMGQSLKRVSEEKTTAARA